MSVLPLPVVLKALVFTAQDSRCVLIFLLLFLKVSPLTHTVQDVLPSLRYTFLAVWFVLHRGLGTRQAFFVLFILRPLMVDKLAIFEDQ